MFLNMCCTTVRNEAILKNNLLVFSNILFFIETLKLMCSNFQEKGHVTVVCVVLLSRRADTFLVFDRTLLPV